MYDGKFKHKQRVVISNDIILVNRNIVIVRINNLSTMIELLDKVTLI
jgi:hypothetical protein